MNYADIKYCDVANGEGVRVSLFVSGCITAKNVLIKKHGISIMEILSRKKKSTGF